MANKPNGSFGRFSELASTLAEQSWLWPGVMPDDQLNLMASFPGVGKSTLCMYIAKIFQQGGKWPDGAICPPHEKNVVWIEGESGQWINCRRAKQMGLDLTHVVTPLPDPLDDINYSLKAHREAIEAAFAHEDTGLVIIDSLSGIYPGDENSSDIREMLKFFADLIKRTHTPAIMTHHMRKPKGDAPINFVDQNQLRGSTAISQLARSILCLDVPDKDSGIVRLSVVKNNLGPLPEPMGMVLQENGIEFVDVPVLSHYTPMPKQSKLDSACDWLRCILETGPRRATEIVALAKENGIAQRTLQRAKQIVGADNFIQDGSSYWHIPAVEIPDDDVLSEEEYDGDKCIPQS